MDYKQRASFEEAAAKWLDEVLPGSFDVAREIGVHPNLVGAWRNGKTMPSLYSLWLIKKHLRLPVEELLNIEV